MRKAIQAALDEDKQGEIDPQTVQAVQTAIDRLRTKFEKLVPQTSPDYVTAHWSIKAMDGLTKMLYSPKMDKVLSELEDYQGTTLGDLLGFMQAFNLQFGSANSYRQRVIYQKLYPMLAEQANSLAGSASGDVARIASNTAGALFEKAGGEVAKTVEDVGGGDVRSSEIGGDRLLQGMEVGRVSFSGSSLTSPSCSPGSSCCSSSASGRPT